MKKNALRLCAVEGCTYPSRALGWCQGHYQRARKTGGDPLPAWPLGAPRGRWVAAPRRTALLAELRETGGGAA